MFLGSHPGDITQLYAIIDVSYGPGVLLFPPGNSTSFKMILRRNVSTELKKKRKYKPNPLSVLLAPHTSGPRDVPRCGALSLLQKDAALQGGIQQKPL